MVRSTTFFIAIPARNAARHVAAALESVAAQDLTGIRVHVHVQDGGSTDGTIEIVRAWSMRFAGGTDSPELVVTWATAADDGMYDAITTAIDAASGRFVIPDVFFWLNADDILMPQALQNLTVTFANPDVNWVIGAAIDLDEAGAVTLHTAHPRIPDADLRSGNFNYTGGQWLRAESTAVRFTVAQACGLFTPGLRLAGDYDLFIKLARCCPPTYVDYPVRGFRRHAGQLSQGAVAYQYERARARFVRSEADSPRIRARAGGRPAHEIVFYPDRTAIDPYQTLLYEGARATGMASIQHLADVCQQATTPLVVHVHWLDQIMAQPQAAAVADARALAQTLTMARARGHRIVFTVHDVADHTPANADVEAMLVDFLFGHANLVHLHHPVVAAEVRGRFRSFPWGRVVFAEHGPYPHPDAATLRGAGLALVGADGFATTTIRGARWAVLGQGSAPSAGLLFHILAAGTPVVAPRLGRIPAYVFDGLNGFLYDPGDEASYRLAVDRALAARSAEAERALGQQAVRAVADLDWPTTLGAIMRRLA